MHKLLGLLCLVSLAACGGGGGGGSPKAACEDLAAALCAQYYECLTDTERAAAGFPATEAACVTQFQGQFGCEATTEENACDAGETYQSGKAADCIDQVDSFECAQIRDPQFDFETGAPACGEVCAVE